MEHPLMNSTNPDPVQHEVLAYLDRDGVLYERPLSLATLAVLSELPVQTWREGLAVGISEGYLMVNAGATRVDPGRVGAEVPITLLPNRQRVQQA